MKQLHVSVIRSYSLKNTFGEAFCGFYISQPTSFMFLMENLVIYHIVKESVKYILLILV